MKPAAFDYARPESLEEALALLAQHGDEAKPIAGGQSLVPLLAMRLASPALLVGLERLADLRGVAAAGQELRIGAMTRQCELEEHPSTPALVRAALPHIGHFQIRSRGTVGGSLAHMDPAAEWPALALAMDGRLVAASRRGLRQIPAAEFAAGPLMTAMEPDELLVEVLLPAAARPWGFAEVARRPGDFALVGAVAFGSRLVVFGAGPVPQRLPGCERYLESGRPGSELVELAAAEIEAGGDVHAPAEYRRRVGAGLVVRVAETAASCA